LKSEARTGTQLRQRISLFPLVQLLLAGRGVNYYATDKVKATSTSRTRAASRNTPLILLALVLAATIAGCETSSGSAPGSPQPTITATTASEAATTITTPDTTPEMKSKLSPDDQALLDEARARGETEVIVLVATSPVRSREVAAAIERLGGTIRSFNEDMGYISARIPIDKVEAMARLDGVQAFSLDQEIPAPRPRPDR
jgi:hypothetical protein